MKTERFTVTEKNYNIDCISYLPDNTIKSVTLCLHGFGGDKMSSAVKRLGKMLTEKNSAVVCFDFPAHGKSELDSESLTIENCIAHTKAVADHIKKTYGDKTELNFFATSFGAFVLLNMLKADPYPHSKILLRSPAVKMEETFLSPICNLTEAELKKTEKAECGFERKMQLGYSFYLDLKNHSLDTIDNTNNMLMVYGDCDDVVKPEDMSGFADRNGINRIVIEGADHRFKKAGQLDAVIKIAAGHLC